MYIERNLVVAITATVAQVLCVRIYTTGMKFWGLGPTILNRVVEFPSHPTHSANAA